MKKKQVVQIIQSQRPAIDNAVIHSVDESTVSIRIGSSVNVIRNVKCVGSVSSLYPGTKVNIIWVDDRPVVLSNSDGLIGPPGATGVQGLQGEKGDQGDPGQQGPAGGMSIPGGRLTLESNVPVTHSDKSNISTLYYTYYVSDQIPLYDGSAWNTFSFVETSLLLTECVAGSMYDVFGYLSGGVLALEVLVWTNTTTRATPLAYSNGHLTKSGDPTRLFLGSLYCESAGTTSDTEKNRYLWNMYNRAPRRIRCFNETNHTYNGSIRKWNNSDTNNLIAFVVGLNEYVNFSLNMVFKSGASGSYAITRMYVDGGTESGNASDQMQTYNSQYLQCGNSFVRNLGPGRHYSQIYEWSNNNSSTFYTFSIDFILLA